jgi:tetratricopeptide (TPR) repeat protein
MPDPEHIRQAAAESDEPLILVPVMADDVARQVRRKRAVIAAIILAVAILGWILYHHAVDPVEAKQSYEDGVRLVYASHYEQAILNFNRAIDLQSNFADAYKMRGRSYALTGNPDKAILDFNKVVELRPQEIGVLLDRGFAYLDRKDLDAALADAVRVLMLDEKQSRAYNLRATVERAKGDSATAIKDFTRAVDLAPNLDNLFQLGATYQSIGDHKHAVGDFTQALDIAPDQPHSYFARAQSKAALGDVKGAQKDIAAGRKIDGW